MVFAEELVFLLFTQAGGIEPQNQRFATRVLCAELSCAFAVDKRIVADLQRRKD